MERDVSGHVQRDIWLERCGEVVPAVFRVDSQTKVPQAVDALGDLWYIHTCTIATAKKAVSSRG